VWSSGEGGPAEVTDEPDDFLLWYALLNHRGIVFAFRYPAPGNDSLPQPLPTNAFCVNMD
jgi:hypothetical protein